MVITYPPNIFFLSMYSQCICLFVCMLEVSLLVEILNEIK